MLRLYCKYDVTSVFCLHNLMQIECFLKVLYLRKFKHLSSVSLRGNPVSKEDNYTFFIAAYFPNLVFLDSSLLDQKTVSINCRISME